MAFRHRSDGDSIHKPPAAAVQNIPTDSHHLHLNDVSTILANLASIPNGTAVNSIVSCTVPTAVASAVGPPSASVSLINEQKMDAISPPGKAKKGQKKIWNTGTTEDLIMDFWHGLSEEARRNLVNMEKDTMRRKMRERQRVFSCSCAACGRKWCVPYSSLCPLAHPFLLLITAI
jgi:hypothetical protein